MARLPLGAPSPSGLTLACRGAPQRPHPCPRAVPSKGQHGSFIPLASAGRVPLPGRPCRLECVPPELPHCPGPGTGHWLGCMQRPCSARWGAVGTWPGRRWSCLRVARWRGLKAAGAGPGPLIPTGSACGHCQEEFLTGPPTLPQPLWPPDHRLSPENSFQVWPRRARGHEVEQSPWAPAPPSSPPSSPPWASGGGQRWGQPLPLGPASPHSPRRAPQAWSGSLGLRGPRDMGTDLPTKPSFQGLRRGWTLPWARR